ncbi:MAG: hypothetical protein AB1422_05820 [bacterium]
MITKTKIWFFILFFIAFNTTYTFAEDKIIEKLNKIEGKIDELTIRVVKLEEGQKALNTRVDDLESSLNKRIDDLDSNLNKRIDDLLGLTHTLLGGILTLLCGMIALTGFILWDRRTAIAPVISKTKQLEERLEERENIILEALRKYALKEPKMATVLRSLNLL